MSEPKQITPLLQDFMMGEPISEHDGVRCCPAMRTDSDEKYIVKILSIPASPAKLEAMLLAGAFPDRDAALAYFQELAQGITEEAALLQRLSRLEGFVPYELWQIAPADTGFEVYLLGAYRPTLERLLKQQPMSHLGAVNLGLDLCAALSACRRSGYMYVDLKPGNVFITNDQEFRIGDLGFVALSSLQYASLPDRYRSCYTPPEVADDFAALNSTMDIYAAGQILYQIYNDGQLPAAASGETLPPPRYADEEMAQIILKACAADPQERWQEPAQMGQALTDYMQRSTVNDTPIAPVAVPEAPEPVAAPADEKDEPSTEAILAQVDEALVQAAEEVTSIESAIAAGEPAAEPGEPEPQPEEAPETQGSEEPVPVESSPVPEEGSETPPVPEEATEADAGAAPEEAADPSQETADILAQADDLIAHQLPDPVVAPEALEVTLPQPPEPQPELQPESQAEEMPQEPEEDSAPAEPMSVETEPPAETPQGPRARPPKTRKKHKGLTAALITLAIIVLLCFGGYLFYENYYLQTVLDISLAGSEDSLTVTVNSEIADDALYVVCTDPYGNTQTQTVSGGTAVFTGLSPSTSYRVQVYITGFHRLQGKLSETYTSPAQTILSNLQATTGNEDGSVILSFSVQGPEVSEWIMTYSAEDVEPQSVSFSGHLVTITGLTVGKEYTFTLSPSSELYITGTDTITFIPSAILYAQNLQILGFQSGALIVDWDAPEDGTVGSWLVRCYNDLGYDKTITVTDTEASFDDLDVTSGYTVEVTAEGMTLGSRVFLSANSITFQDIQVTSEDGLSIQVAWTYEGAEPEGGWLLLYAIDGSDDQQVVQCDQAEGVITPLLPGCHYDITIQPASGVTVFGGTSEYDAPQAEAFSGYLVTAENILLNMCRTPEAEDWDQDDVAAEDYTTIFAVGESASFVTQLNCEYNTSSDLITILYVIRDADGNLISNATQSMTWTSMWYRSYGKLTIPFMPEVTGEYTVAIYFNGQSVAEQAFTVVEVTEETDTSTETPTEVPTE